MARLGPVEQANADYDVRLPSWEKGQTFTGEVARGDLIDSKYMQGAAYLLGRRLVEFVARQPFEELLTLPYEDWSVGAWTAGSKSRAVHDYIDATCPDTPAARRFFGWLTRR